MSEACDLLRPSLGLYAEGELRDSAAIRRVRRHLDRCIACRKLLAEHDRLTREILARGAHTAGCEADWWYDAARGFSGSATDPSMRAAFDALGVRGGGTSRRERLRPGIPSAGGSRLRWWEAAAAAVLLLAAGLAARWALSARGDERLELAEAPRAFPAAPTARAGASPPGDVADMRWILGEDPAGLESAGWVLPSSSVYGAPPEPLGTFIYAVGALEESAAAERRRPAPRERRVIRFPELVVEVLLGGTGPVLGHADRLFLVRDPIEDVAPGTTGDRVASGTWVEILPVSIGRSTRSESEQAREYARRTGAVYRVVPVRASALVVPEGGVPDLEGAAPYRIRGGIRPAGAMDVFPIRVPSLYRMPAPRG